MIYRTVQHYDALPDDEKCRSSNVMTSSRVNLFLRKWLTGALHVILIGALALFGCSPEQPSEQGKQSSQDKKSAVTTPVHKEVGEASWYGPGFQGKETSSGETYDQGKMTAAHPSLPMGTKAEVTNLENKKRSRSRLMIVDLMPSNALSTSPAQRPISLK